MTNKLRIVPEDVYGSREFRTTKTNICPVCQHADWCSTDNDEFAICMRVSDGRISPWGEGSLHALRPLPTDGGEPEFRYDSPMHELADKRGWSLEKMTAAGCLSKGDEVHFPMTDHEGNVTGWRRRMGNNKEFKDGSKAMTVPGEPGKVHGLFQSLDSPKAKILLVEGETDFIAALTTGFLNVLGTPGCSPGGQVKKFLSRLVPGREVIMAPDPGPEGIKWRGNMARLCLDAGALAVSFVAPWAGDLDDRLKHMQVSHKTVLEIFSDATHWTEDLTPPPAEPVSPEPETTHNWRIREADSLPAFPVDSLPYWMRDHAKEIAEGMQMPVDAPATMMLGMLGLAIGPKIKTRLTSNRGQTSAVLWVISALPTGSLKSPMMDRVTYPVVRLERRLRSGWADGAAERKAERETWAGKAKKAKALAVKGSDQGENDLKAALQALEDLEETGKPPRILAQDYTIETLLTLMHENDGTMAIVTPEGGLFNHIADGRYGADTDLDPYLKAYTGEHIIIDRSTRNQFVGRPCLPILTTPQPEVISAIGQQKDFQSRGFLARWLYSMPEVFNADRKIPYNPDALKFTNEYDQHMDVLLDLAWDVEGEKKVPYTLTFDEPAGRRVVEEQNRYIEIGRSLALEEDHPLIGMADWASKVSGSVERIAALLYCAENEKHPDLWGTSRVTIKEVENAVLIMDYFQQHAIRAYRMMGLLDPKIMASGLTEDADEIISWMRAQCERTGNYVTPFTPNRLGSGVCRSWAQRERIARRDAAIFELLNAEKIECPNGWGEHAAGRSGPVIARIKIIESQED